MEEKLTPRELLAKHRYKGKLTSSLQEKAVHLVKCGVPPKNALRALGVADTTIRLWKRNAETNEKGPKYRELFEALEMAEQQALADVANNARRLTEKDGRTALDYLSRRDSEHWSRTDRLEVDGTVDAGPVLKAIAEAQQRYVLGEYKIRREDEEAPEQAPRDTG